MRILHDGHAGLRFIDDDERFYLVDPYDTSGWADVKGHTARGIWLSGGPWADRLTGTRAILASGAKPVVVAEPSLAGWLGDVEARDPDEGRIDGIAYTSWAYEAPVETTRGVGDKLRAALRNPRWALGRLGARRAAPVSKPRCWRFDIDVGHRIVHLGLALHRATSDAFVADAAARCHGAVVIAGYLPGDDDAFVQQVLAIQPARLLLMDVVNDLRRDAGLPIEIVTPTRDRILEAAIDAHPFVSGVSVRFEKDDTVKRW